MYGIQWIKYIVMVIVCAQSVKGETILQELSVKETFTTIIIALYNILILYICFIKTAHTTGA